MDSTFSLDNDLARRAREGDLSAFEQLFNKHQKRVYNIALQMLGDESEAADITQEAFVKVYRSLSKLNSDAAFVTWLKTITINLCRDILRKRGNTKVSSLDEPKTADDGSEIAFDVPDSTNDPEKKLQSALVEGAVRSAISRLAPYYREVVVMACIDGMSIDEIAKVLGSPAGTIKSRLSRARTELKRHLAPYVEFEK